MKRWALLLFCFLFSQLSSKCLAHAEHTVKVGIYDNKPLVFTGSDGKVEGFLIDILEYIADIEGWQIKYVPGYLAECLERLERGEIDLLVGIEYSRERNRIYDFTYEDSLSDWAIVYSRRGLDLNQIVNLDHKKIAVLHDDIHYHNLRILAKHFGLDCRFIEVYEYDGILKLIDGKRVDAVLVNRLYGLATERDYDAVRSSIIFSPTEIHFAVPKKKNTELIAAIDSHLMTLKGDKNSIYYQSLDRWSPTDAMWAIPKWLLGTLAVAGGLLLLSLAAGLVFRSQVKAKTLELSIKNQELELEAAERKRVEEALRLTQFSIDHSGDCVFWFGSDARLLYVNQAGCKSLGYSAEELTSMSVHDIDPNFQSGDWPAHWQKLKKLVFFTTEFLHRRKDGSVFPVELAINHLEFEGNEYHCTFARDITERKKVEEERESMQAQLRQAQKMEAVGTLAGGIAHDFNNILQAVQGYAELLILGKSIPRSGQQELEEIVRAAKRGAELTRQLLTFSRKVESRLRPTDLSREVVNVRRLLERTVPKMIKIELSLTSDLKIVNADPGQVEQVLVNLAVNAKDAMPEGGKLVIKTANITLDGKDCRLHRVARPGDYVQLTVSDTGHGIDEDTLEHIFEPFYTTKGPGQGTGLGLATVYGIVESHNGYITAHSRQGEGSTFKIYLPALDSGVESVQLDQNLAPLEGGTETILLVDDEESIRKLGCQILETFGYTVHLAADGESALERYREAKGQINLVVLDLIMPGMGGRRCLEELLKVDPEARIAITSGYSPEGPARETLINGARGFVSKPYEIAQMLREIRKVLDQE
jgi:PAS domain S-box-containing protein